MAKRGLVILLPLRVRPTIAELEDEIVWAPPVVFPEEVNYTLQNPPTTTTPTIGPGGVAESVMVHDIIALLPRVPENRVDNTPHEKSSLTIHWEGDDAIPTLDVNETVTYLRATADFHINKDWGGGAHGDGLMYHEVIGQNGDVYIARDYTEVLWHCGVGLGNMTSRAILVLCSSQTPANDIQIATLRRRIQDFKSPPVHPHSYWSATQCPGDKIRSVLA